MFTLAIVIILSDITIKRVMIDNGLALNLCTFSFIKQEGYVEANIIDEVIILRPMIT